MARLSVTPKRWRICVFPRGTSILDDEGLVWQYGPPEFGLMWFPANGYRDVWYPTDVLGGPEFPVRVIHMGAAQ